MHPQESALGQNGRASPPLPEIASSSERAWVPCCSESADWNDVRSGFIKGKDSLKLHNSVFPFFSSIVLPLFILTTTGYAHVMFDIASIISRVCYILTVFFNSTLIYLTVYHTKEIVGTYRNMIVTFAVIGIFFSTLDILVRPLFYSFNGCVLYFTLGNSFRFSKTLSEFSLLLYAGSYAVILGFLSVQFVYRASVLSRPKYTPHFDGWKLVVWLVYSGIIGLVWSFAAWLCYPDDKVYQYLRTEMLDSYGVEIKTVAGFAVLAYNGEMGFSALRWNSVATILLVSLVICSQYSIMLVSGLTMYRNIKGNMNTSSSYYANLQKQFFMTLVYQVSAPSLLFHAPAFIVLVAPFADFKFSFHSGIIVYGFSAYPLVDSLLVLSVISEYRNAFKKCVHWVMQDVYECLGGDTPRPPPSNHSFTTAQLAKI